VLNASGVRTFDVSWLASPLNVAAGLEARREAYSIFAGEPNSYLNGGVLLNGDPTPSGAQVFPGFRPANATDEDRTAVGAYLDLEGNLSDKFLGSVAVRAEDYSDFGSNVSGKVSGRYDFTPVFALRGSVQNGFRAPSLQQQFFATTSTNFINGVPFDITTFPATDPVAQALGARQLDAEKSVNFSLGAVWRIGVVSLTVDGYRINIDDRVVLSENLTQANVRNYLQSLGFVGVGGGRFFINGVDTKTTGVDMVVNAPLITDAAGRFDFTLVGNYNKTEVTKVPQTQQLAALNPAPPLFDRINVLSFEEGTPRTKVSVATSWSLARYGATLRATRYGEVLDPGTTAALDAELGAKTVVDLEARVNIADNFKFAVGAENLFDEYPDAYAPARNTTGNTAYSNYAPFGRSGRFLYGRVSLSF
jgi:iron complex outermembrane recepter protein